MSAIELLNATIQNSQNTFSKDVTFEKQVNLNATTTHASKLISKKVFELNLEDNLNDTISKEIEVDHNSFLKYNSIVVESNIIKEFPIRSVTNPYKDLNDITENTLANSALALTVDDKIVEVQVQEAQQDVSLITKIIDNERYVVLGNLDTYVPGTGGPIADTEPYLDNQKGSIRYLIPANLAATFDLNVIVSSEANYDFVRIYKDGELIPFWQESGSEEENVFTPQNVTVRCTSELIIEYAKDFTWRAGYDVGMFKINSLVLEELETTYPSIRLVMLDEETNFLRTLYSLNNIMTPIYNSKNIDSIECEIDIGKILAKYNNIKLFMVMKNNISNFPSKKGSYAKITLSTEPLQEKTSSLFN